MRWRRNRADRRVAALAAASLALLAAALPGAAVAERVQAPAAALGPARDGSAVERVLRYWTPERMRSARPLDLVVDRAGRARISVGAPAPPSAAASFLRVPTPDTYPYSVNGRIFVRQGGRPGYCSGTAIDSPTRQLVLTAGHCLHSGPEEEGPGEWSSYLQFVPAYSGGLAPFGAFIARRSHVYAPRQWIKTGNPDFDLGAFLVRPNAEGVNLADAVGGGATIVMNLSRKQEFQTFGYPGRTKWMQGCRSPYIGDDTLTYPFPGPPTLGIRCRWAPGASGGGWMIEDGTQINGVNSYLHLDNRSRTFGPYFTRETVGKLVAGF